MRRVNPLLDALRTARRPLAASEIGAALAVSQPVVSRAIAAAGDAIVRLGRARAARYALARTLPGFGARWPLATVDADGRVRGAGVMSALAPRGTHVDGAPLPALGDGDLPWFLADAAPAGFLGQAFARRHGAALGAPAELAYWREDHVLAALLAAGADLPGAWLVGDAARERVQRRQLSPPSALSTTQRGERYAELAARALADDAGPVLLAGEQPKFGALVEDASGVRHVLVKFSEAANTPAKRRWLDLLLAEHHALAVLGEHGVAAAATELVPSGERLCLEVARFDRVGAHGRRHVVSLGALDDALYGRRDDWRTAADRLLRDRWIDTDGRRTLHRLYWFGALIANTDMHFGNASFFVAGAAPFAPAPAYDMLPMLYRPAFAGELVPRTFVPALPPPDARDEWAWAVPAALALWQRIADDARVSLPFRKIATENHARVAEAGARFG